MRQREHAGEARTGASGTFVDEAIRLSSRSSRYNGLYRQIRALGHSCLVVAPSLIPTRPGGHIKTDRRDATMLASLFRAGELQSVWVPDAEHEAMRELIRGRQPRCRKSSAHASWCCHSCCGMTVSFQPVIPTEASH